MQDNENLKAMFQIINILLKQCFSLVLRGLGVPCTYLHLNYKHIALYGNIGNLVEAPPILMLCSFLHRLRWKRGKHFLNRL